MLILRVIAVADTTYFSAVKSLLTEIELESSIGKGLPQYNLHVASLFEEVKSPVYVAEFCQAALISLGDSVSSLHSPSIRVVPY